MPMCANCEDVPAIGTFDRGTDYVLWTGKPREIPVCDDCRRHLENREPPEPDGEAFRGGEAAAYERDHLAEIQRRLK